MKFGEQLSEMIKLRGFTVNQVATQANIPPSSLYSLIQRNGAKIDIDAFFRICDVLNCKPEDFGSEERRVKEPIVYTAEEAYVIRTMNGLNENGMKELVNYCEYLRTQARFKKVSNKNARRHKK